MSLINKITVLLFCLLIVSEASAQEIKKVGKFKDWETIVVTCLLYTSDAADDQ